MQFISAGESHGPQLSVILEGVPAGLEVDMRAIDSQLARRQQGYGRGGRMAIEKDQVQISAGLINGISNGAPLCMHIQNRDWENWKERFASDSLPRLSVPRPGHADYAGMKKYGLDDARPILERASARETAARVAVGAVCRQILSLFGVSLGSYVDAIGGVRAEIPELHLSELWSRAEASELRCPDPRASKEMMAAIDRARDEGDSLGGSFVLAARGVPLGLGSHVHWQRKIDARLTAAIMSIPAIKGVEIGPAFENSSLSGHQVHDSFKVTDDGQLMRGANRAGGIEGGMTNGQPIVLRAAMKPIPSTTRAQASVDLCTGQAAETAYQRSDVCAVPAAAVVGEAMLAFVLADALVSERGIDHMGQVVL